MNVLYVSHTNGIAGGAGLSLFYLMGEMIKKGVNVYLLVPEKSAELTYPYRLKGIKVIGCPYEWWMKENGTYSFLGKKAMLFSQNQTARKIADRIRKFNIDIVHTNTSVINIGGLISKYANIPHVWHIREFAKEHFNLDFCYGSRYSIRFMNQRSSRIIAISQALSDKYKPFFGDKISVIYNGISSEYVNPKKEELAENSKNILISGTISPNKGQEEAILAIGELTRSGYENVQLYIAGNLDKSDYREKLDGIIHEYGIGRNIHFVGYQNDLKELRQNCVIELMCSKNEAFGRVTVEAMLSMNPVIGANAGGTRELVIDGYNGLLYKSGDYHDLAEKIRYMLDSPEKIKAMGENAYNYALENFTAEKNAEEIFKVYCELLNQTDR